MVSDCVGEWMDGIGEDYDGFLMLVSGDGNLHSGASAVIWIVSNHGVDGADGLIVLVVDGLAEA